MTSLSDSQNIDLGPNGAPNLPPGSPLQACPHCDALIDITEREPLEVIQCPGCGADMAVGAQLGKYTITDVAGRGGMGVVYKAYDPALDRLIAIKLLRADRSTDPAIIQQLENEAAITASVNHPNVVCVYNTGMDRNRFFIAMELVDKGSLDDLIRLQGRVAELQVLEAGIQIAKGLKAAYLVGLIHRDVKPGNILFADSHHFKIVDFGLAIFQAQEESVRGEIWGTPYYVAPEKLDNQPEDFRSDMYSLGASLFHALAGRPPFEAENASLVALKHLKAQKVSLQAFAPWVSNTTAHIINRTLQKAPDQRYQTYDELIQNLEFALEELQQRGAVPQQRARVVLETEEDQKQWTYLTIGIAAAILILVGVFFVVRSKMSGDAKRPQAVAAAEVNGGAPSEERYGALEKQIEALANREPNAAEQFRAAANSSKLSPTDRAWAQYFEGLAQLSQGNGVEARGAFQKVAPLASRIKDGVVGGFLRDSAAKLSAMEPVAASDASALNRKNHEAVGLLAYGLHNWQLGKYDEGTAMLREFRSAKPAGNAAWLGSVTPLGMSVLEDLTAFNMKVDRIKAAQLASEKADVAVELRKTKGLLAGRVQGALAPFAAELAKIEEARNAPPVKGLYKIMNVNSGKGLDVRRHETGDSVQVLQWGEGGNPNQQWIITPLDGGLYKIAAAHSGKMLEIGNSRKDDGAPVQQYRDNGTNAQRWRIEPAGDGKFRLRAECSGRYLTVENASKDNDAKVVQRDRIDGPEQLWTIPTVGVSKGDWFVSDIGATPKPGSTEIEGGTFKLSSTSDDLWLAADSFHYVSQGVRGDFVMVARVAELHSVNDWTKAGIVVRGDMTPGARNVAVVVTSKMDCQHQVRSNPGGQTTSAKFQNANPPVWVKVERAGTKVSTFHSKNGKDWVAMKTDDVQSVSGSVLFVGLALTSHNIDQTATAKFDNVQLTVMGDTP